MIVDLLFAAVVIGGAVFAGIGGGFLLRDWTERARAEAEWLHALSSDPRPVDIDRADAWKVGYDLALAGCRVAVFEIEPSAPDLYTVIADESGKVIAKSLSTFSVAAFIQGFRAGRVKVARSGESAGALRVVDGGKK